MFEMLATFYSLLERPPLKIGISVVVFSPRRRSGPPSPLLPFPRETRSILRAPPLVLSRCLIFLPLQNPESETSLDQDSSSISSNYAQHALYTLYSFRFFTINHRPDLIEE